MPAFPSPLPEDGLFLEPEHLELGRVVRDTQTHAEFWIFNPGQREVSIQRVDSSCGCTAAFLDGDEILAGDALRGYLTMTVPRGPARFEKRLTVHFTDGRSLAMRISGESTPAVVVEPAVIRADEIGETTIMLTAIDAQPFRVLGISPSVIVGDLPETANLEHSLVIDRSALNRAPATSMLDLFVDHPKVSKASVRLLREESESLRIARPDSMRDVQESVPRLRLDQGRIRLPDIAPGESALFELTARGPFAETIEPIIGFQSAFAEAVLIGHSLDQEGLHLQISLNAHSHARGHVRSELTVQIGAARGSCQVFARIDDR